MNAPKILIAGLAVFALTGCTTYHKVANGVSGGVSDAYHGVTDIFETKPGSTIEFVSASSASVLVDYGLKPAGEQKFADGMAKDKCGMFGKQQTELESLNPRGEDRMRATYLCK